MHSKRRLTDLAQIATVALEKYKAAGLKCVLDCRLKMCKDKVCLHVACTHQAVQNGIAEKVKRTTQEIKGEFSYLNWSPFPVYYVGMKGKFHNDVRRDYKHKSKLE
jgi:hypothetical protein